MTNIELESLECKSDPNEHYFIVDNSNAKYDKQKLIVHVQGSSCLINVSQASLLSLTSTILPSHTTINYNII